MSKNALIIISIAFVSTLLFSACSKTQPNQTQLPTPTPTATVEQTNPENTKKKADYELVASESGQIALDLLKANAQVETKDYGSAGQFVTSINGLEGDNSYYWAFYLNGKYAEQGASQTKLNKGDIIKFVYEAVALTQ